jgi:uncharacterized protein DUF1059
VDKVLQCDCRFEARGEDEEALVADVRRHAREAHGMALSLDEALLLAFRAELGTTAPLTLSDEPRPRPEGKEE